VTKVPKFPPNRGPEVFRGQVLHTMDYSRMEHGDAAELIRGRRVVVVGSGKSGLDTAAQCADANGDSRPLSLLFYYCIFLWGINGTVLPTQMIN
jgi:dimethylaniline monooxygenase (N-oxide forming)